MGDIDENTPPINVLLPICNETNTDVFFEILESVVLHERLHDSCHLNSIISGMAGETFQVDKDDLRVDWKNLTSVSRQIRQNKLIGFWAARNYPLIGKKLIAKAWQPPKECNVQCAIEITGDEIDKIVSRKMQLRIIELNVCKGTSKKLNNFVRVPMGVGKVSTITTVPSSKMKVRVYDIQSEYLAKCWEALRLGVFPSNSEKHMESTPAFKAQPLIVKSHSTIDQHQIVPRNCGQSTAEKRNFRSSLLLDELSSSSQVAVMSPCNVLLSDISASTAKNNVTSKPKTIPTAKRARYVSPNSSTTAIMHDETNIDVLRVAVCEMRKDIQNLTKCLGHNAAENENELRNGSERFHLAVFKQKDYEISRLTESLQRLQKESELFKDEKTKLCGEIETKSNLICALQKLLEANSKLHGKMEEESNAMVQKLADENKLKIVMTETNDKLQEELTIVKSRLAYFDYDFQNEKQDLLQKLSAANQLNCQLTDTNGKLREELNVSKNHSANVESNLQDLVHKLSVADEVNVKLTKTNGKLQEDLNAVNSHFADIELNQQSQIQGLLHNISAADKTNTELIDTIEKLQQELKVAKNHSANVESNLQDLVQKSSAADEVNVKLTKTNGKLQEDLNAVNHHFADIELNQQYQIQGLLHNISAADKTNTELIDTIGKLQQELDAAKIELEKNKKLSESLHNLQARTNILINEFRAQVEGTEEMNTQLAGKNEKLQEELNILKQNAGEDKELLLLPNLPETHIQTERKEVPLHDGYDQAELEEEIIQCIGVVGENYEKKLPIDRASNEGHIIEPYDELQTDRDSNELPPEPVKSGVCVTVEPKNVVQNGYKFFWKEVFVSDDPIVQQCRPVLQQQKFGWMKFQSYKSAKFCPAFVYPVDEDGLERAQKIKAGGCITNAKSPFWEFHFSWKLPDDKKQSLEVLSLKKFNKRFGANFA